VSKLHKETDKYFQKPLLETVDYSLFLSPSLLTLNNSLTNSDCLPFIRYIPENTLNPCRFLVQINHAQTTLLNLDLKNTGDYHVTFISRHSDDSYLCDDTTCWFPLWHEYKNHENDVSIYDVRIVLVHNVYLILINTSFGLTLFT